MSKQSDLVGVSQGSAGDPLYVDSTNNKVGIGTASPATKLHLNSSSTTAIAFDSDTSTQQYEIGIGYGGVGTSSFYLYDNTASAARMVIDSSGRVGIGTSSPDTALNIGFSGADQSNALRIEGSNGSSEKYALDIEADGENAKTNFKIGVGGGAPTTRMTIDSSGRVTMPYQPAFHAYVDGLGLEFGFGSTVTPVPYAYVTHNNGNHYNNSNSTFTAPVAGQYAINASASFGNNSSGNKWVALRLVVNGSVHYGNGYAIGSVQVGLNNNSYDCVSASYVVNLNANDTVCLQAQYNTFNGNMAFGSFSGYLIG